MVSFREPLDIPSNRALANAVLTLNEDCNRFTRCDLSDAPLHDPLDLVRTPDEKFDRYGLARVKRRFPFCESRTAARPGRCCIPGTGRRWTSWSRLVFLGHLESLLPAL